MDPKRFDLLTRKLVGVSSRRTLLGALAAVAASPLVAEARPRGRGPSPEGPCGNGSRKDNICSTDDDCCTGICNTAAGKKNKDKKGRCRCVRKGGACAETRNCCFGRACENGVCGSAPVPPPPPPPACTDCDAGCCLGSICVPYASQSASQCGSGGAACAACTGSDTCSNGVCTPTCDATNCAAGCCNGTTCVAYSDQTASQCGTGGAACDACTGSDICTSGVCTAPTCDASNCSTGCCNGTTCVPYASQDNFTCGTGGGACTQCPTFWSCGSGQCFVPCDLASCDAGCCNGNICVPYASQSTSQCGTHAAACAACTGSDTCSNGVCTPTCDATNCAAGCCNGTTCVPYASQSNDVCGTGGGTCSACPVVGVCNGSGVCVLS